MVSGASYARMLDLVAPDASANLSGGSQAWVDVGAGYISLMASGASTLNYRGSPNFDIVDLSGGSRVQKVY